MTNIYRLPGATPDETPLEHTTKKCPSCGATRRDFGAESDYYGIKLGVFCRGGWWARWRKGCSKGNHLHMECTACGWRWIVWP